MRADHLSRSDHPWHHNPGHHPPVHPRHRLYATWPQQIPYYEYEYAQRPPLFCNSFVVGTKESPEPVYNCFQPIKAKAAKVRR